LSLDLTLDVEKIENELKEVISSYYDIDVKVEKVEEYKYYIEVNVYRKYYEISEYCASALEESPYISEELSEDEIEELFNECMQEALSDINAESMINLELEYTTDYAKVRAYPLRCFGDYCRVGLAIEAEIVSSTLSEEDVIKLFKPFLEFVHRVYTAQWLK